MNLESLENFYGLGRATVEQHCERLQVPAVHAATLFRQSYKKLLERPWEEASIPKVLARSIAVDLSWDLPQIATLQESSYDGSQKFLFRLDDGQEIESVLMPEKSRLTICLSSQVGCQQACVFCHTGRMGLKRQLKAHEIIGQYLQAALWMRQHPEWLAKWRLPIDQTISNIVFMGMGEPLDNVEEVAEAIRIFNDPLGLNVCLRKISVSTAGHLDGLRLITAEIPDVRIALSLHEADDQKRSKLMPINRRWPIADVIDFFRDRAKKVRHDLLIQYTVIAGVNDQESDADEIVRLLAGIPVKINLIPLNPVGPSRLRPPSAGQLQIFRDILQQAGLRVMVRYSKGQDIAAACGQLVRANY